MELHVYVKRQKSKLAKNIVQQLMHWWKLQKDRTNYVDEVTQTDGQYI